MLKKYKKQRVVLLLLTLTIIVLLICGIGLHNRTKIAHSNSNKIVSANSYIMEGITSTQDFILFETKTSDLYNSKMSINLKQQDAFFLKAGKTISTIDIEYLDKDNFSFDIDNFKKELRNYNSLSVLLCYKYLEKGFKDYGKIGEMRNEIHFVEKNVNKKHEALLLSIRRHEKDYLLRNQQNYIDLVHDKTNKLVSEIHDNNIKQSLKRYITLFDEVVIIDQQIGLQSKTGIMNSIRQSNYKLRSQMKLLSKTNHDRLNNELNTIERTFVDIIVYSTIVILIGLILSFVGGIKLNSAKKPQITYTS